MLFFRLGDTSPFGENIVVILDYAPMLEQEQMRRVFLRRLLFNQITNVKGDMQQNLNIVYDFKCESVKNLQQWVRYPPNCGMLSVTRPRESICTS